MEENGSKRKAESDANSRSGKRIKQDRGEDSITVIKEGVLRVLIPDKQQHGWKDATVKLYSNSDLEWKITSSIESVPSHMKCGRSRVKPGESAVPVPDADYVGLFCLRNIRQYWKFIMQNTLLFASKDPNEGERWMHLINYTRLKCTTELRKHNHPLTPCDAEDIGFVPHPADLPKIGPSVINTSVEELECSYCGTYIHACKAQHCEFCTYDICEECARDIDQMQVAQLGHSSNHPQHPLVKLNTVNDPSWFTTDYDTSYICDVCNVLSNGPVYHCVECGNYDECPNCFKQLVTDPPAEEVSNDNEMQLDVGLLSHVITKSGNVYELNKRNNYKVLQAASMITTKCWDVSQIDSAPVPSAYFEVTFHHLEGQYVSVGVANQIFVQNQLLGYEQNSFGYCNNGHVTQNVGTNLQMLPSYGNGDTVGVGMLLDSFNMRRLYFTKNGQLLGCFNERVHVGMDCFPGVSFTPNTCQRLKFSVNTIGPFIFDPNSVPDYRSTRENWFEQMPTELIVKCLSTAAQMHHQVAEFFNISKTLSSVASNNEIWKPLFLQKWPMQNSKLKIKSWMKFYKRRHDTSKRVIDDMWHNAPQYWDGPHFIENCDFEFECPLIVEDLFSKEIDEKGNAHCDKCNKTVYKVEDKETLEQYAAMGRCVSLVVQPKLPWRVLPTRHGGVISMPHTRKQPAVPPPFPNVQQRRTFKK